MISHKKSKPGESQLRRDISRALQQRGKRAARLRVSLSLAEWYTPPGASDKVWVRWLCWRLVSKNGHNVTSPKYGVLHGGLAKRTLHRSLRDWFPEYPCIIDSEIELS